MLIEDRVDDGGLGERLARLGRVLAFGLVVVDVEAKNVPILDGVRDGVLVQFLLKQVLGGLEGLDIAFDPLVAGVILKDRRAGEAKELGVGEEILDRLVIIAKLRAMALVEDEYDALVAEWFQPLTVIGAGRIECPAELLDGTDDDLVGGVIGFQPADEGCRCWCSPRRSFPGTG